MDQFHDQGAGGASNMITELVHPNGARINLRDMRIGDPSLSQLEAWIAESQEIDGLLLYPQDLSFFNSICRLYDCPIEVLGEITGDGKIVVYDELDNTTPVDLPLNEILGDLPQKTYTDETRVEVWEPLSIPDASIEDHLKKVAHLLGVGLPTAMANTFDGSVGGMIVQGPRDGIHMLPVCSYGIKSQSFEGYSGSVMVLSISNAIAMQIDEKATSSMVVPGLLSKFMFTYLPRGIREIKGRLNVMYAFRYPGGKIRLCNSVEEIVACMVEVELGLNGGKDSLSMLTKFNGEVVPSFDTLVYMAEAHIDDFRMRVTPTVKGPGALIYIDLAKGKMRMGGSSLGYSYEQLGNEVPDFEDIPGFLRCFDLIQQLIKENKIKAGLEKQKGGLIATVAKMAISQDNDVRMLVPRENTTEFLFNEEAGIVIQCEDEDETFILNLAKEKGLTASVIGDVFKQWGSFKVGLYPHDTKKIDYIFSSSIAELRKMFMSAGREREEIHGVPAGLLEQEESMLAESKKPTYKLTFDPDEKPKFKTNKKYKVGILTAPGSNGEDELGYFYGKLEGRFEVRRITLNELLSSDFTSFDDFSILSSSGGFSFGDVLGSGVGWAAACLFNQKLKKMFDDFYARPDTLSFDPCNGFQKSTLFGVFNESFGVQPRLLHNDSRRFEHRWTHVMIPENTNSVMFAGMGGSVLGVWSAHGQGKFYLPDEKLYQKISDAGLVALQYADYDGNPTSVYPLNPNGSPLGIAGVCTKDGRHTDMMPHIERVIASNHHMGYYPAEWNYTNSVWLRCVENMYLWLEENSKK